MTPTIKKAQGLVVKLALALALVATPPALVAAVDGGITVEQDDWCCENTGCEGGEHHCITLRPEGGGEIECWKTGGECDA